MMLLFFVVFCFGFSIVPCIKALLKLWANPKVVPEEVERDVRRELSSEYDGDIVDAAGNIVIRVGAALRIAKIVKLKFGGTPSYSAANKLLAARYINTLLEDANVRVEDRTRILYRVRALVFTKLKEEMEEDQWTNSAAAGANNRDSTGWFGVIKRSAFGWGSQTYQRTLSSE